MYNDLHAFDPPTLTWVDLSAGAAGTPPMVRIAHGLAALGGWIYVHAGYSEEGTSGDIGAGKGGGQAFRRRVLPQYSLAINPA